MPGKLTLYFFTYNTVEFFLFAILLGFLKVVQRQRERLFLPLLIISASSRGLRLTTATPKPISSPTKSLAAEITSKTPSSSSSTSSLPVELWVVRERKIIPVQWLTKETIIMQREGREGKSLEIVFKKYKLFVELLNRGSRRGRGEGVKMMYSLEHPWTQTFLRLARSQSRQPPRLLAPETRALPGGPAETDGIKGMM